MQPCFIASQNCRTRHGNDKAVVYSLYFCYIRYQNKSYFFFTKLDTLLILYIISIMICLLIVMYIAVVINS